MTPDKTLSASGYTKLLNDLRSLWEAGKSKAHRAVTHLLLETYWNIGGRLADEQLTQNAGYEKAVMERLAEDMRTDMTTLYRCIQFHETYSTVPESDFLSWSHFRVLLTLKDPAEREKFTEQAEKNRWTRDQLLRAVQVSEDGDNVNPGKVRKLRRPDGRTYVFKGIVLEVVDGDTLVLDIDCGFDIKKKQRIRLAEIDCPEIETDEGKEAADYVRNQLARVPYVMVQTTKVDINGRFLGHVFYSLDDTMDKDQIYIAGRFLNQELLDKGFARHY
jgi:endonuclease YncB( thermonuclease family)